LIPSTCRDQKLGPHSSGSREFACGFFCGLLVWWVAGPPLSMVACTEIRSKRACCTDHGSKSH